MIEYILIAALGGAIWGSFLNVVAYRLLCDQTPFFPKRSYCPACKTTIAWFDLIPIFSFLLLRGRCRHCSQKISFLYLFIETITAAIFVFYALTVPTRYLPAALCFASLFVITIRTDFEARVIFRLTTLFALPFAYLGAYCTILPLSATLSLVSSLTTYLLFLFFRWITSKYAQQEAFGLGDVELLTLIAALCGPIGTWIILTSAAALGTAHGVGQKLSKKTFDPHIPFGAYLALSFLAFFPFTSHTLNHRHHITKLQKKRQGAINPVILPYNNTNHTRSG